MEISGIAEILAVATASGGASWMAVKVELRYHWDAIKKLQAEVKDLWLEMRLIKD